MENIFIIIFAIITQLLFVTYIIKMFFGDKIAPVKTVKAEVIDKYKKEVISKNPKIFTSTPCVIVFKTEKKNLSFLVSEFSCGSYRIKEKGTLKYKGRKIISFK